MYFLNIWIVDHYSVPVKYYPLARQRNFARYLIKKGHDVTIFCASSVHNSTQNLIEDDNLYKEIYEDDIRYVLIKCKGYKGNGLKRVYNMLEFAFKMPKVLGKYRQPDIIISTSMTQFACAQGIRLARKYKCKVIAQITDLWPETLISYGIMKEYNPIILGLRLLEKWTYQEADRVIFSMKGGYDYICQQKWQNEVPKSKVKHINNGVDLDEFNYNKTHYKIDLPILYDKNKFKVVYTGSIRMVNNVGKILDVAQMISNPKIVFLIFGDGDQLNLLKYRVQNEQIKNVRLMGYVEKRYIPCIVSNADLNFAHNNESSLFKYGVSFNKIFDYFAAGKPVITDFACTYNPVVEENAGISVVSGDAQEISSAIEDMAMISRRHYDKYCENSLLAAQKYDFKHLTDVLEKIAMDCIK